MSRHHHRPRKRRKSWHHDPDVIVHLAAATPDQLERAKRMSHDLVIAALGDRRRSGVTWQIADTDPIGSLDQLLADGLFADPTAEEADHLAGLRTFLENVEGAVLIVTSAEGVKP